jgi:hypothetical protein
MLPIIVVQGVWLYSCWVDNKRKFLQFSQEFSFVSLARVALTQQLNLLWTAVRRSFQNHIATCSRCWSWKRGGNSAVPLALH